VPASSGARRASSTDHFGASLKNNKNQVLLECTVADALDEIGLKNKDPRWR
jgi:hypothetical protein